MLCLKNLRLPTNDEIAEIISKQQDSVIGDILIENVTYDGRYRCTATLKFKLDGQSFELKIPDFQWKYPKK